MPILGLGPKKPTDYTGWKTAIVPCVQFARSPTTSDTNYNLLTLWLDNANNDLYVLVGFSTGLAQWRLIADGSSSGDITNITVIDSSGTTVNVSGTGGAVGLDGAAGLRFEQTATSTITGYNLKHNAVTGTTQQMLINSGYTCNNASLVTCTLPAVAAVGTRQKVSGKGAGLFAIAQNAGQLIRFNDSVTTTGATGTITALERYASVTIECITANTDWEVIASEGNFLVA